MFQVEMRGLTGTIKFDNQGFRTNFVLDIIDLSRDGLRKIGTWNSTSGVNFTRTYGEEYTQIVESLHNKTMIVTTILVGGSLRTHAAYFQESEQSCVIVSSPFSLHRVRRIACGRTRVKN